MTGPAPSGGPGTVEWIHVAPGAGAPMRAVTRVRARPGHGLDGDRYGAGGGTWSDRPADDRDITFVEAEVMEDLARQGIALEPGTTRRNVTTRGIRLNELVGRRFRVGGAGGIECEGTRLCEPCTQLQATLGLADLRPLVHRAGLRVRLLAGGEIAVGDPITVLDPVPAG